MGLTTHVGRVRAALDSFIDLRAWATGGREGCDRQAEGDPLDEPILSSDCCAIFVLLPV
jgi:hypothetical protein